MNVFEWSAAELAQKIKAGELSAPEAVEAVTAAIDSKDGTYNCYTSLNKEAALQQAETVQSRIDAGGGIVPRWPVCLSVSKIISVPKVS